jgi:hypothetical protein
MALPSQAGRREDTERVFAEWTRRKNGEQWHRHGCATGTREETDTEQFLKVYLAAVSSHKRKK